MKRITRLTLIAGLVAGLAACSTPSTPEQGGAQIEQGTRSGVDTGAVGQDQFAGKPWNDPKSTLYKRSVYFDYDSFVVKGEYQSLVEAHARYLAANPGTKVLIQGNTDDRGSREYNLALGQKRSDAVKKAMKLLGASEEQIESVSLGEEKPKSEGQNEAAWAENRRADILYPGEF